MKKYIKTGKVLLSGLLLLILIYCRKEMTGIVPVVTIEDITHITGTSALTGGLVSSDGGTAVTSYGVCWSTSPDPTISDNKTENGSGVHGFMSTIPGLSPGTTYYVKAYAINSAGTGYSLAKEFSTLAPATGVTTKDITDITTSSAKSGGFMSNDGGAGVTDRGVCWSTNRNPTVLNNKTADGNGSDSFTSSITGLLPNTIYYVRAYAVNSVGTSYGNEISFTTNKALPPAVTTAEVSNITLVSAISGGTITDNGGDNLIVGVCWSTSAHPTTSNSITALNYFKTGNFSSTLYGLQPLTKYYIRSYATNSAGTAYGNELSFNTSVSPINYNPDLIYGTVSDIDGNIYKTVRIGTQVWMAENLKTTRYRDGSSIPHVTGDAQWENLTGGGYCWYDNDAAIFKDTYGALYNWYAVTDGRKICPTGWHPPTSEELNTLVTNLGGENVAGGKAKEAGISHWVSPNGGANNESGFTALPGGGRFYHDDSYPYNIYTGNGYEGSWWSATSTDSWGQGADFLSIGSNSPVISTEWQSWKNNGLSVRCLKDN